MPPGSRTRSGETAEPMRDVLQNCATGSFTSSLGGSVVRRWGEMLTCWSKGGVLSAAQSPTLLFVNGPQSSECQACPSPVPQAAEIPPEQVRSAQTVGTRPTRPLRAYARGLWLQGHPYKTFPGSVSPKTVSGPGTSFRRVV